MIAIVLIVLTQLWNFSSEKPANGYLEVNSDPFDTKPDLRAITNHLTDMQRSKTQVKSRYRNFLEVALDNPNRQDYLDEFLSEKIQQYMHELTLMLIPEYRFIYSTFFRFIKTEQQIKETDPLKIGPIQCDLGRLAHENPLNRVSVCPWHWRFIERTDVYPFIRANAFCSCSDCLADTVYDSTKRKLSHCKENYIIMPALVREKHIRNGTEKWWFSIEEVPNSCSCKIKLSI